MDRFTLLAPALLLFATMVIGLIIYAGLCAAGRPPRLSNVKHNQLLGPFMAGYLVWMISPIERAMIGRVSPNTITAVSLFMCAATGVAAAFGHLGTAVWCYAFGGILDILDGRLARRSNQQTKAGALFDSVSDRWAELFVFSGYAWYLRETPWLLAVMAAIGSSLMVSYTRARAESLGIELHGGMMQRAERVLLTTSGTLLAGWFGADPAHADKVVPILGVVMTISALAASGTALNRWLVAYRELSRIDAKAAADLPVPQRQPVQPMPEYVPVPAKLRESAELAPAAPRI